MMESAANDKLSDRKASQCKCNQEHRKTSTQRKENDEQTKRLLTEQSSDTPTVIVLTAQGHYAVQVREH
jgi:hypothetical protein